MTDPPDGSKARMYTWWESEDRDELHRLRGMVLDRYVELEGAVDECVAVFLGVDQERLYDAVHLLLHVPGDVKSELVRKLEVRLGEQHAPFAAWRERRTRERGHGIAKELAELARERNEIAHTRVAHNLAEIMAEQPDGGPLPRQPPYVKAGPMRGRGAVVHGDVSVASLEELGARIASGIEDLWRILHEAFIQSSVDPDDSRRHIES